MQAAGAGTGMQVLLLDEVRCYHGELRLENVWDEAQQSRNSIPVAIWDTSRH